MAFCAQEDVIVMLIMTSMNRNGWYWSMGEQNLTSVVTGTGENARDPGRVNHTL